MTFRALQTRRGPSDAGRTSKTLCGQVSRNRSSRVHALI